jgi:type IV pilus assembly protein PilB
VRKICDKCKTEVKPTDAIEKVIREQMDTVDKKELEDIDMKNIKVYIGRGCPVCGNTGYRGRIGIYEMLAVTNEIQNLINNRAPTLKLQEYAIKQEHLILMQQDGILKALRGITTVEEVVRATKE